MKQECVLTMRLICEKADKAKVLSRMRVSSICYLPLSKEFTRAPVAITEKSDEHVTCKSKGQRSISNEGLSVTTREGPPPPPEADPAPTPTPELTTEEAEEAVELGANP